MYEFLYSVFEWIEWASDSTVHSDGLTCFISIDSATLNESFDMNDSLSNLLKQGLAVTYWRFYCHIWQLLVQSLVISRLDYCNAPLAGLPNTIKPLQMIQNAVARLVFNEPKRAHVTPLFISLHWLPVATRIKFKTLMLAHRTTTGSAPAYFHSLLRIFPSRSMRSASERRLVVPSQRGSKSLSRTFSFTVPGWWNDLPTPIRTAGSLSIFKQQLKTHLFRHYLTSS